MNPPWQVFNVTESVKHNLRRMLSEQSQIFSFDEEPLLASLTACLGLQFEVGHPGFDRLSRLLSIDITKHQWSSEIIQMKGEFGIRLWVEGVSLNPTREDLLPFFHPLSIVDGQLQQLVIFPYQVARQYKERGIECVVVRDWSMSSFLCEDPTQVINYTDTSVWEIEQNSAFIQCELMFNHQQPFTGAHDIADHLVDGHRQGRLKSHSHVINAWNVMNEVFVGRTPSKAQLMVAYLVGVILDDLAQPRWYGSKDHEILLNRCLELLVQLSECTDSAEPIRITIGFNQLVNLLREKNDDFMNYCHAYFGKFSLEVLGINPSQI